MPLSEAPGSITLLLESDSWQPAQINRVGKPDLLPGFFLISAAPFNQAVWWPDPALLSRGQLAGLHDVDVRLSSPCLPNIQADTLNSRLGSSLCENSSHCSL
jgi:hypothetical protein